MQWKAPTRQATYKTWLWRVGSPPVGRLAARRRAAVRHPLTPRPGPVDARPRGTQAGDREKRSVWRPGGGATKGGQHRVQGRKWHLGGCRGGRGDQLGESPSSAVQPLEQGALTGLGGSEVGRKGGTTLLEAGVGLEQLGLALGCSGSASDAGLTRSSREVRGQGRTPVGGAGRGSMWGWARGHGLASDREGTRWG